MKKLRRRVLKAAVLLAVLAVVLVVGLIVFVDAAAKQTITRGGSYATMADTSVDHANVSLLGGRMTLTDFAIGNPEGYDKTPYFMELDDTEVVMDNGSLFADTVEVRTLTIDGVDLYLDKTHSPGNYNQILENLARFEDKDKPAAQGNSKKVVIRLIEINDITVHVAGIPLVQQLAGDVAVEVSRITLENVGEGGGLTVAQLFGLIIKAIVASVFQAGDGILPGNILTEIGHGVGELAWYGVQGAGFVFDVGEGAVNLLGDGLEGIGDAAGSVLGGIGDLITGGDDEEGINSKDENAKKDDGG